MGNMSSVAGEDRNKYELRWGQLEDEALTFLRIGCWQSSL
jgi:hypothetical protein